jgi:integrase
MKKNSNTIRFTDITIKNLKPSDKRVTYSAIGMPGLLLRVTPTGRKTFAYMYWFEGRQRMLTIGAYGKLTLKQAIKKYAEAAEKRDKGLDPAADVVSKNKKKIASGTINDVIDRYEAYCISTGKKDVATPIRVLKATLGKECGHKRITTLTRDDCIGILQGLIERGVPQQANHCYSYMNRLMNLSVDWGLIEHSPMDRVKKPAKTNARSRFLNMDEIASFLKSIKNQETISPMVKGILRFMLFTGLRPNEAARIRWNDLDLPNKNIKISDTKNGRDFLCYLNDYAIDEINAMENITRESEFIFAISGEWMSVNHSDRDFEVVKVFSLSQAVRRMIKREEIEVDPFTPHDLRRTFSTQMTSVGVPRYWVDAALNHVDNSVLGQHYDLYDYSYEKEVVSNVWGYLLDVILSSKTRPKTNELRDIVREKFLKR